MFVLKGHFSIGNYTFDAIHQVEISHSTETITDTAVIKMPTQFTVRQNGELKFTEEVIKVGDAVSITIGYEGRYEKKEFEGYVSRIKCSFPMEIYCEDATYLLKRKEFKFSKPDTSLKDVLNKIVEGTPIPLAANIPDVKMDKFTLSGKNCAQALQYLIEKWHIGSAYINDKGELYAGLQQVNQVNEVVTYNLNGSLVANDLEFKSSEDKRIRVVYEGMTRENVKIRVELGDKDGDLSEVKTKNVTSKEQLQKDAQARLETLKYGGFDGDVTSFLIPYANKGMTAKIVDEKHPNRNGFYFIKKVITTYGTSGARRKITLGKKLMEDKK